VVNNAIPNSGFAGATHLAKYPRKAPPLANFFTTSLQGNKRRTEAMQYAWRRRRIPHHIRASKAIAVRHPVFH